MSDGCRVTLKDLGPQINWKTVFILEYLGPLVIHQVAAALRPQTLNFTQFMAYACITFHFLKREYETLFVHRFSHATMPLRNLAKNCAHYWLISGVWIAYDLYYGQTIFPTNIKQQWYVLAWSLIFFLAELGNLYSHMILGQLRSKNPKARAIPRGFGFDWVSCPNYTFECLAWFAFSMMTGLKSSWAFTILSTVQMYLWARKKHSAYRREFSNYPKNRTAMFPFLP